jgi:hypothetical protein
LFTSSAIDELLAARELPEEIVEDALTLARLRRLGFAPPPDSRCAVTATARA